MSGAKQSLSYKWEVSHPAFPVVSGILALVAYLSVAWFVFTPQALWSPDEGAKLLQLQNLRLENGRLAYSIAYGGRELDPDLRFAQPDPAMRLLRVHDVALQFRRLPLFPLLVLPLFRWLGSYGLYLLPAIGGAAVGMLALGLLERNDRRSAMWMLIAFGSPVFIYAAIFWEHTIATGVALAGACLALHVDPARGTASSRGILVWIVVGMILGLAVYIRLETVIFALVFLVAYWVVVKANRWGPVWAVIALGLTLLPYMPLHRAMFGQGVPDNATYLFYPFRYLFRVGWRAVPDLLIGPFQDEAIDPGLLGSVWAIAAVVAVASSVGSRHSVAVRNLQLLVLGITAVTGAAFLFSSTLYRSGHGLLFTTPWALLGLYRAREVWQRGNWRARIVVLSTILGLIGYVVGIVGLRASSPHGGLEWGARFAMTFYPLLALIAVWDLGAERYDVKTLVVVGALLFLGFGFQARGIWTIRHDKQISAALNQMIVDTPEQYIVSDLGWMPFNAAPIYYQKTIYVALTPDKLGSWIELVAAHQVQQFYLVTLDGALPDKVARVMDRYKIDVVDTHQLENLLMFQISVETKQD